MFLQPLAETTIRGGLKRFANVQLRLSEDVVALSQDAEGVSLDVQSEQLRHVLRAKYVVGADGGRSAVRKFCGIELTGKTDAWRWLVIDLEGEDRFLPFSGVYCHPKRPYMSIDLPYGHRRFEFRLLPEESDEEMQRREAIERLLAPHYPPGTKLQIKRSRIYTHHSRIAERFKSGRVMLAGDAAHLQPPFFGQGMNSGLRDATNLAWKLAAVLSGRTHPSILDTYETERRDHAVKMVNFATAIGSFYAPNNFVTEAFRDLFFRLVQSLPSVRDYVLQMKFKPLPRYINGVVAHPERIRGDSPVGRMFVQPLVETSDRRSVRLDDAIGDWFSFIGINQDPAAFLADEQRRYWISQGATFVQVNKSRRLPSAVKANNGTIVLDDVSGAFRDWKMAHPSESFIILRPDWYLAAICGEKELMDTAARLRAVLEGLQRRLGTERSRAPGMIDEK
jgi:3-(3-hydroxy-phenyl)propionate hydroxylase